MAAPTPIEMICPVVPAAVVIVPLEAGAPRGALIDSSTDDVTDFYSGPVFFEPPIVYDEPINRDEDLDADAALWAEGFGFSHHPLSEGVHELHLLVYTGLGFGFDNTWTITVIDDD